ncbi:flavin reductase (NADPH) [Agelaius phoeniceus]|uniref:flavin reductase (NADPH) n=1 Tax=Agelaius phoeniceus TaxID=39638 RepID=UPI004054EE32
MKIAIFGATGRTGRVTLGLALEQGFEVTVLVRDPSRLPPGPAPHRVLLGDARDPRAVGAALQGQEGALIVLGTGNDLGTDGDTPTTGPRPHRDHAHTGTTPTPWLHPHLPSALAAFLLWDPARVPERLRALTEDHRRMERLLRGSGLRAVLVMPPHIAVDQPLTGDYEVTVGAAGGPGSSRAISAPDLGHFLLRCLREDEFDGKSVYVSRHYPKE